MTFTGLRDAGAKRLTDSGARLLDVVVATPGDDMLSRICGEGRLGPVGLAQESAIARDLAGGSD